MQFHLFQYSLPAPPELEDLNAYLGRHRVASVSRHVVQTAGGAMLVFVVETAGAGAAKPGPAGEKIDYREKLSAGEFAVFSRLRDERKKIAEAEGIPVYAVFSNAQLAEMVSRRVRTAAEMAAVEGVGKARIEKHAARLLPLLLDLREDGTGGEG